MNVSHKVMVLGDGAQVTSGQRGLAKSIAAHLLEALSISAFRKHVHMFRELMKDELLWHADPRSRPYCSWQL